MEEHQEEHRGIDRYSVKNEHVVQQGEVSEEEVEKSFEQPAFKVTSQPSQAARLELPDAIPPIFCKEQFLILISFCSSLCLMNTETQLTHYPFFNGSPGYCYTSEDTVVAIHIGSEHELLPRWRANPNIN